MLRVSQGYHQIYRDLKQPRAQPTLQQHWTGKKHKVLGTYWAHRCRPFPMLAEYPGRKMETKRKGANEDYRHLGIVQIFVAGSASS